MWLLNSDLFQDQCDCHFTVRFTVDFMLHCNLFYSFLMNYVVIENNVIFS